MEFGVVSLGLHCFLRLHVAACVMYCCSKAMPGLFYFVRVTPVFCGPQNLEDCAAVISCAWFYWLDPSQVLFALLQGLKLRLDPRPYISLRLDTHFQAFMKASAFG